MSRYTRYTPYLLAGLFLFAPIFSHAAQLLKATDYILTSEPNKSTSHSIEFTNTNDIPASGVIKFRFNGKGAPFIFPNFFDYTNMELSVSRGNDFESYPLDSYSDISTSSATFLPISDGEIDLRIASDDAFMIPANSRIRLRLGGNSESPIAISNPNSIGSHLISISTYDPSEITIDAGFTMTATILPVSLSTQIDPRAPTISNGLPKGLIPGGTKKVFVSMETNVPAFCRYSFIQDVLYENMPSIQSFKSVNFNRLHYFNMDVVDDTVYNLYARCYSKFGLISNTEDYVINFEVGIVPKEKFLPPTPPGTQAGNNTGGGNMLGQSALTIEGKTFPSASVVILKDGKEFRTVIANQQGNFSSDVTEIDRGTYGFMITATSDKARSASFNTVLYVTGPTHNTIGPVYMSPVINSKIQRIDVGGQVVAGGKAVPFYQVQVIVVGAKDPLQQPYVLNNVTPNGNGDWSVALDTSKLPKGTYSIRAQSVIPGQGNSQFSPEFLLGIGEKPQGDNKRRADINGDGKINIADLSIMLFSWKKSSPTADINMDGTVNITDFSIMLSSWTG